MSSVPGLSGAVGFGRRTRGPSGAGLLFPEAGEYGFALVSIGQQIHFANPGGYDPGGYIGIGAPGAEYMLNYVLSAAVAAGPPVVFPLISSDRSPPPNFPGFVAICAGVITRFGISGFRLMPLNEIPQIFGRLKGLELNADVRFVAGRTWLTMIPSVAAPDAVLAVAAFPPDRGGGRRQRGPRRGRGLWGRCRRRARRRRGRRPRGCCGPRGRRRCGLRCWRRRGGWNGRGRGRGNGRVRRPRRRRGRRRRGWNGRVRRRRRGNGRRRGPGGNGGRGDGLRRSLVVGRGLPRRGLVGRGRRQVRGRGRRWRGGHGRIIPALPRNRQHGAHNGDGDNGGDAYGQDLVRRQPRAQTARPCGGRRGTAVAAAAGTAGRGGCAAAGTPVAVPQ